VSNLDPELAEDALELLVACVARRGETLVVNIHQPELARRFATRIVGLAAGRVMYDGAPDGFTAEKAALLYRRDEPGRGEKAATGKVVAIK
jgi:phosphonate transport system ATP-binding protein